MTRGKFRGGGVRHLGVRWQHRVTGSLASLVHVSEWRKGKVRECKFRATLLWRQWVPLQSGSRAGVQHPRNGTARQGALDQPHDRLAGPDPELPIRLGTRGDAELSRQVLGYGRSASGEPGARAGEFSRALASLVRVIPFHSFNSSIARGDSKSTSRQGREHLEDGDESRASLAGTGS